MRLLPIKPSHTSLGRALVLPEKDFSFLHLRLLVKAKLFSSIAIFLARRKVGQTQTCPLRGFGPVEEQPFPFSVRAGGEQTLLQGWQCPVPLPCAHSTGGSGERNQLQSLLAETNSTLPCFSESPSH